MTFKGFNIAYPEYEVVTPQTHSSYSVRSINVSEEEKLKGSLMTPQKVVDHLNRCIFELLIKKPKAIDSYETFLKSTTIKDREALLYGLYHVSYGEIRDYDVECSACTKIYPVTIKASDTFNFNKYPDNDILTKVIKVDLPVTTGVSAFIKQPTLDDENSSNRDLASIPNASEESITDTLIVQRFEQDIPEKTEPLIYDSRIDILDALRSLPALDKRHIHREYMKNFGDFCIELKMKSFCQYCGNEEVMDINLVSAFFRELHSV